MNQLLSLSQAHITIHCVIGGAPVGAVLSRLSMDRRGNASLFPLPGVPRADKARFKELTRKKLLEIRGGFCTHLKKAYAISEWADKYGVTLIMHSANCRGYMRLFS